MEVLNSIFGLLICLSPVIVIIAFLIWATHMPACPKCHYGNNRDATTCSHCGEKLAS
jgi:hypothetical protein